jgi:hypothetical protein
MRYRFYHAPEAPTMKKKHMAIAALFIFTQAGSGLTQLHPVLLYGMAPSDAQMQMDMSGADDGIPSYHAYALKPPIPKTLDPNQFSDALNRNVYALAAKIKAVLYQQPCYCYCDRHEGHKSLLDCYATDHGSKCDICQREAVLADQLTRKGKTPAQIRAAIIRGDWKSVDLNPYLSGVAAR